MLGKYNTHSPKDQGRVGTSLVSMRAKWALLHTRSQTKPKCLPPPPHHCYEKEEGGSHTQGVKRNSGRLHTFYRPTGSHMGSHLCLGESESLARYMVYGIWYLHKVPSD